MPHPLRLILSRRAERACRRTHDLDPTGHRRAPISATLAVARLGRASISPCRTAGDKALTGGLSTVMMPTLPRRSWRTACDILPPVALGLFCRLPTIAQREG